MQHLVVLLPVLNEALGLDWVLKRLPIEALKAMELLGIRPGDGRS